MSTGISQKTSRIKELFKTSTVLTHTQSQRIYSASIVNG